MNFTNDQLLRIKDCLILYVIESMYILTGEKEPLLPKTQESELATAEEVTETLEQINRIEKHLKIEDEFYLEEPDLKLVDSITNPELCTKVH